MSAPTGQSTLAATTARTDGSACTARDSRLAPVTSGSFALSRSGIASRQGLGHRPDGRHDLGLKPRTGAVRVRAGASGVECGAKICGITGSTGPDAAAGYGAGIGSSAGTGCGTPAGYAVAFT